MINAADINAYNGCAKKRNLSLNTSNARRAWASSLHSTAMRWLNGEQITDPKADMAQTLGSNGVIHDSRIAAERAIAHYSDVVKDFAAQLLQRGAKPLYGAHASTISTPRIVNIDNTDIAVSPDYYISDATGQNITIGKILTTKPHSATDDAYSVELYALQTWGKKAFPNAVNVNAEYSFIKGRDDYSNIVHNSLRVDHSTEANVNAKVHSFNQKDHICSPADCASCPQTQLCNYLAPKIASTTLKPLTPLQAIETTPEQQEVIELNSGLYRVFAPAGTGKTLAVALRIVRLLSEGIKPEECALLTFTNTGAEEMRERVQRYLSDLGLDDIDTSKMIASTFNGFGQMLSEEYYQLLGYSKPPTLIDDEQKASLVRDILDKHEQIQEWTGARGTGSSFDAYMNMTMQMYNAKGAVWQLLDLFDAIDEHGFTEMDNPFVKGPYRLSPESISLVFKMYQEYQSLLLVNGLIDYHSQIANIKRLCELDPSIPEKLGLKHITIDEAQDTNASQNQILKPFFQTNCFESLLMVGDTWQAIMGFRGSTPDCFNNCHQELADIGEVKDHFFTQNFRSQGRVIDFGNKINDRCKIKPQKKLQATIPAGKKPLARGFYSAQEEINWIADEIQNKIQSGINPSDIAVIVADRHIIAAVNNALAARDIPAVSIRPDDYMDNSAVQAALGLIDYYNDPRAEQALSWALNVQQKGTLLNNSDANIIESVENYKALINDMPHNAQSLLQLLADLDPMKQDEVYQAFLQKFEGYHDLDSINKRIRDFRIFGQKSSVHCESRYDGVVLTTVHSAKGLEWPYVYTSVSKWDKPSIHGKRDNPEHEEKLHLLYVAATRARTELCVTGEYLADYDPKRFVNTWNEFLQLSYDALGQQWDCDPTMYDIQSYQAKANARHAELKANNLTLNEIPEKEILKFKDAYKMYAGRDLTYSEFPVQLEMLSSAQLNNLAAKYTHMALVRDAEQLSEQFSKVCGYRLSMDLHISTYTNTNASTILDNMRYLMNNVNDKHFTNDILPEIIQQTDPNLAAQYRQDALYSHIAYGNKALALRILTLSTLTGRVVPIAKEAALIQKQQAKQNIPTP